MNRKSEEHGLCALILILQRVVLGIKLRSPYSWNHLASPLEGGFSQRGLRGGGGVERAGCMRARDVGTEDHSLRVTMKGSPAA